MNSVSLVKEAVWERNGIRASRHRGKKHVEEGRLALVYNSVTTSRLSLLAVLPLARQRSVCESVDVLCLFIFGSLSRENSGMLRTFLPLTSIKDTWVEKQLVSVYNCRKIENYSLWKRLWEKLTSRRGKTGITRSLIEHEQDRSRSILSLLLWINASCAGRYCKGLQSPGTIGCICKNNTNLEYTTFLFMNKVWPYESILKHFWNKLRHIKGRNTFILHLYSNIFLWANNQFWVL